MIKLIKYFEDGSEGVKIFNIEDLEKVIAMWSFYCGCNIRCAILFEGDYVAED